MQFDFARQLPVQAIETTLQLQALQQLLLFRGGERRQVGGDEIGEATGFLNVHHHGL